MLGRGGKKGLQGTQGERKVRRGERGGKFATVPGKRARLSALARLYVNGCNWAGWIRVATLGS